MRGRVLVLLLAAFMAVPLAASETKKPAEPKTDLQKFRHTIQEINAHTVNAGTKLKLGAVGLDRSSTDAPARLAQLCCGNNLEEIGKQLGLMAASARSLQSCYRENSNADGEVKLNFVRQDAGTVFTAVEKFSTAKNEDEVQSTYAAMARALLLLQKSAKDLTECP